MLDSKIFDRNIDPYEFMKGEYEFPSELIIDQPIDPKNIDQIQVLKDNGIIYEKGDPLVSSEYETRKDRYDKALSKVESINNFSYNLYIEAKREQEERIKREEERKAEEIKKAKLAEVEAKTQFLIKEKFCRLLIKKYQLSISKEELQERTELLFKNLFVAFSESLDTAQRQYLESNMYYGYSSWFKNEFLDIVNQCEPFIVIEDPQGNPTLLHDYSRKSYELLVRALNKYNREGDCLIDLPTYNACKFIFAEEDGSQSNILNQVKRMVYLSSCICGDSGLIYIKGPKKFPVITFKQYYDSSDMNIHELANKLYRERRDFYARIVDIYGAMGIKVKNKKSVNKHLEGIKTKNAIKYLAKEKVEAFRKESIEMVAEDKIAMKALGCSQEVLENRKCISKELLALHAERVSLSHVHVIQSKEQMAYFYKQIKMLGLLCKEIPYPKFEGFPKQDYRDFSVYKYPAMEYLDKELHGQSDNTAEVVRLRAYEMMVLGGKTISQCNDELMEIINKYGKEN